MKREMKLVIDSLYAEFAHYRLGDDFTGCECCVRPEQSVKLAGSALRDLSFEDLESYSRKAMSTWGEVRHFKHFLPRLLELTVDHRDDVLDLPVVFGKLAYAQFESWSQRERDAVNEFFFVFWETRLADQVDGPFDDAIDDALCALSNALPTVQPFLDRWTRVDSDDARRHTAAFILCNADALLKKGRLSNAFWDVKGRPHAEVVKWLVSDAVTEYLGPSDSQGLSGDLALAWPQLTAIRASLLIRLSEGSRSQASA